ncbi:MAG: hypothetical protein BAJALOKI1v1_330002 [Promethearchaeota archaeon]|nr:MAG: hypothetical protein BAJALOKI1v1_330002 [Candidatus Lokiarchaeota archaeon]
MLQSFLRLRGPKTIESVERRIRAWIIVRNDETILDELQIERNIHGKFLINNLKLIEIPYLEKGVICM